MSVQDYANSDISPLVDGMINLLKKNLVAHTPLIRDAHVGDREIFVDNNFRFDRKNNIAILDNNATFNQDEHAFSGIEFHTIKDYITETNKIVLYQPLQKDFLVSDVGRIQKAILNAIIYPKDILYGDRDVIPFDQVAITVEPEHFTSEWIALRVMSDEFRLSINIYTKDGGSAEQEERNMRIRDAYANAIYNLLVNSLHIDLAIDEIPLKRDGIYGSDYVYIDKNYADDWPEDYCKRYAVQDNFGTDQDYAIIDCEKSSSSLSSFSLSSISFSTSSRSTGSSSSQTPTSQSASSFSSASSETSVLKSTSSSTSESSQSTGGGSDGRLVVTIKDGSNVLLGTFVSDPNYSTGTGIVFNFSGATWGSAYPASMQFSSLLPDETCAGNLTISATFFNGISYDPIDVIYDHSAGGERYYLVSDIELAQQLVLIKIDVCDNSSSSSSSAILSTSSVSSRSSESSPSSTSCSSSSVSSRSSGSSSSLTESFSSRSSGSSSSVTSGQTSSNSSSSSSADDVYKVCLSGILNRNYLLKDKAALRRIIRYIYDSRASDIEYGVTQKKSAILKAARMSWWGKETRTFEFPQVGKGGYIE